MTQPSPIRAPGPTTTLGKMIVPAPTVAPAPIVTNGPIDTSAPIAASLATALRRSTPFGGGVSSANSETARANAEYGSSVRSTAQRGGGSPGLVRPRITADASVVASCVRY